MGLPSNLACCEFRKPFEKKTFSIREHTQALGELIG
jgi:hypothetical protein